MISLGGRIPQIVLNHQRGNSGELSLISCGLNVLGCIARAFTTIVLTKVSGPPLGFGSRVLGQGFGLGFYDSGCMIGFWDRV